MTIFEGVGDPEQTQNELRLLLTNSVFNSALNDVSDSNNLGMSQFEVLSALLPSLRGIY